MKASALVARSSESVHRFRQMRRASDSAGSTTAEENDSNAMGPV